MPSVPAGPARPPAAIFLREMPSRFSVRCTTDGQHETPAARASSCSVTSSSLRTASRSRSAALASKAGGWPPPRGLGASDPV